MLRGMANRPKFSRRMLNIRLRQLADRTPPNWLLFIGMIALIVMLLVIPPPFSTFLFGVLLVTAIIFGVIARNQRDRQGLTLPEVKSTGTRRTIRLMSPRLLAFGAVILMILGAIWFAPIPHNDNPFHPRLVKGFFSMILGGWVLGLALTVTRNGEARPYRLPLAQVERPRFTSSARPIRWMVILGGLILLLVGESNGQVFNLRPLHTTSPHMQFVGLVIGVCLVTIGMIGRDTWNWSQFNPTLAKIRVQRYELWFMLGIALLALGVRFWQLNNTARVMVDEMNFASHIVWFWEEPDTELLNPMSNIVPFTRIFSYWASWLVEIFGRNLLGFRAISAIMGTGTVIAVWWLARHIFDRKTALLSALILATFPPHLHFSRLALNNIGDPLFATIAFGFLARGFQTHNRRDFAFAGVALGCVPYFYEAGRLTFPLLTLGFLAFVLIFGLRFKTNSALRQNLFVFVIVAILTAMPTYYALASSPANFTGRLSFSAHSGTYWDALFSGENPDGGWKNLANSASWSFLFYINKAEDFIHYGGHTGLIITAIVPFFFLGLWQAIWRIFRRDAGSALLVAWVIWTGLGNSILTSSYVSTRYVLVFPALAILIAVGLRYTLPLLVRPSPRMMNWMLGTFAFLIVFVNGVYYFGVHLPIFEGEYRTLRHYRDIEDAILRSTDFRPGTQVHLVVDTLVNERDNSDLMNFVVDGITTYTVMREDFTLEYVDELRRQVDQAIYLPRGDESLLALLTDEYGVRELQYSDNPHVDFSEEFELYFLPAVNYIQPANTVLDRPARHRNELKWLLLSSLLIGSIGLGGWHSQSKLTLLSQRAKHMGRTYLSNWRDTLIGLAENISELFSNITEPLIELLAPIRTLSMTMIRALTLCALGVMIFAMFIFLTTTQVEAGLGVTLIGTVLIGLAGYAQRDNVHYHLPRATTDSTPAMSEIRSRRWLIVIGGVCLVVLTFINTDSEVMSTWGQLALWSIGVGGVAIGLIGKQVHFKLGSDSPPHPASQPRTESAKNWRVWGTLFAILTLALILRVHNLEFGIHRLIDELHSAQAITDLWETPDTPILTQHGEVTAFTWFYPMLQRVGVSIYGPSLTGLRVISAFVGVLTVWAVWWFARTLFDDKIALLTALILAVFPPHVHFSRIGINNIIDPLIGILALTFIMRGMRDERRTPFVLAGLLLGLTTYFYEGGRLLFPPLTLGFIGLIVVQRWARKQTIAWRGLMLTAIMFAVVSLPVYLTWSANELAIFPRFDSEYISLGGQDDYTGNLLDAIHVLVGLPDTGWFYGGEVGLILGVFVPVFLLGIAHAIRRFREPRMGLLLFWLGAVIIGNSLLANSGDASRYVVLFPAIALLIALGIVETLRLLVRPRSARQEVAKVGLGRFKLDTGAIVLTVFAFVIAGINIWYYFTEHIPDHQEQFATAIISDDMLFRMKALPTQTNIFVMTNLWVRQEDINTILRFYGRDDLTAQVVTLGAFDDRYIEDHFSRAGRYAVFLIESHHPEVIPTLLTHFGIGTPYHSPYELPNTEDSYTMYYFSAAR